MLVFPFFLSASFYFSGLRTSKCMKLPVHSQDLCFQFDWKSYTVLHLVDLNCWLWITFQPCRYTNQIKSLLLSHHHSTSALVSEIQLSGLNYLHSTF